MDANVHLILRKIAVACPEWRGLKDLLLQIKAIGPAKLQWLAPNGGD